MNKPVVSTGFARIIPQYHVKNFIFITILMFSDSSHETNSVIQEDGTVLKTPNEEVSLATEHLGVENSLQDVVQNETDFSSSEEASDNEGVSNTNENIIGGANDPFVARMQPSEISLQTKASVDKKEYTLTSIELKLLGRLNLQIPSKLEEKGDNITQQGYNKIVLDDEELEEGTEDKFKKSQIDLINDNLTSITSNPNLDDLYIKRQLLKYINTTKINNSCDLNLGETCGNEITPFQLELLKCISVYKDLSYNERTFENGEQIRFCYTLHALNHIFKTRDKVMRNNLRIAKQKASRDKKEKHRNLNVRDQGLVRPKVLMLVPFRDSAYRIVEIMEHLIFGKGTENASFNKKNKRMAAANVAHKRRFQEEYGCEEQVEPETAGRKPPDYYRLFSGNSDDCFKIGLACSKNSLKLFTDFYSSDIIIASPLGVRQIIQTETEKDRDHDFLASIELLIVDQVDVLYMMNWSHVIDIIDTLHQQPAKSHDVDFARVRMWSLNGLSKYYRQTLLFSSLNLPEVNAVFNKKCWNFCGRIKIMNPIVNGSICQIVTHNVPIIFRRFEATSIVQSVEDRMNFFIHKTMPNFKDDMKFHTLIFVPSYLDLTQVRNWFSKKSYLDFAEVTEYTKYKMMAASRDRFFHGDHHFLLYTERAHFYKRYAIKGIRHLIFYQIPIYPKIFAEMCNLMQSSYQNRKGGSDGNMSCTVLYNKYDIQRLTSVVGSDKANFMIKSEKNTHMFMPGETFKG